MKDKNRLRHEHDHGGIERQKQGISSFNRYDTERVFAALALKEGCSFLDLGCGAGDYSLEAAKIVGPSGTVYALDQWEEVIAIVTGKAHTAKLHNVKGITSDISSSLPFEDKSIDVCFIAQVLHGLDLSGDTGTLLNELVRIIKPGGKLAIIEFKKEETGFGPPLEIRVPPQEVEKAMKEYGFEKTGITDLGHSYMIQFKRTY
ncbi:MAG: methyltransferase domain-containing protein [Candidatus Omnitrophica bacterium]|nr:methyltransferase domain-containing protein [Candidatus Omnitrophota bacterium]